jgi:putative Mg2+ transporter-C (MgtC) family protein
MAGIVTGVGFLGAGMIFRDGDMMRGLTSAAALWAAAAVGMLAGIGEFLIAVLITALILLILEARYLPVLRRLDAAKEWRARRGMNPPALDDHSGLLYTLARRSFAHQVRRRAA